MPIALPSRRCAVRSGRAVALVVGTGCGAPAPDGPSNEEFEALMLRVEALEADAGTGSAGDVVSEDLADRIEALESDVQELESSILDVEADTNALLAGDLAERVTGLEADIGELDAALASRAELIEGDVVVEVDSNTCSALREAIASLDRSMIAPSASVTIRLQPGEYSCADPVVFAHPDGARVALEGATGAPDGTILNFVSGSSGLQIRGGANLGMLAGVTLRGSSSDSPAGISVGQRSMVQTDGSLVVEDFGGVGISVYDGGAFLDVDPDNYKVVVQNNGGEGVLAAHDAVVTLDEPVVSGNGGAGIQVIRSSSVVATGAVFADNGESGIYVSTGSFADVSYANASGNGSSSYWARHNSTLYAPYSTGAGYTAQLAGYVYANSATSSGGVSPAALSESGAYVFYP